MGRARFEPAALGGVRAAGDAAETRAVERSRVGCPRPDWRVVVDPALTLGRLMMRSPVAVRRELASLRAVPTRCATCGTSLEEDAAGVERQPCPSCGSTARVYEEAATVVGRTSVSAEETLKRGLNELRLAVLGIVVAIGLTVGLGVQARWWIQLLAGAGSFVLALGAIGWRRSRHVPMELMHRVTGG